MADRRAPIQRRSVPCRDQRPAISDQIAQLSAVVEGPFEPPLPDGDAGGGHGPGVLLALVAERVESGRPPLPPYEAFEEAVRRLAPGSVHPTPPDHATRVATLLADHRHQPPPLPHRPSHRQNFAGQRPCHDRTALLGDNGGDPGYPHPLGCQRSTPS